MSELIAWWLSIELLGLTCLPLAFLLFRNLPDRGYAFSKALGLLLVSYALWITACFGVLPNSRGSVIFLVTLLAMLSLLLVGRVWPEFVQFFKTRVRLILYVEVLFLIAFLFGAFLRSLSPGIEHTEQPMDFAFLNGILRSEHFPPLDPWLSGHTISYYYFGYLMVAVVVQLSGVPSSIGFNLALSMLFALTAIGAYGVVFNLVARAEESRAERNLRKAFLFAPVAAFLILVLGNFEGVLEILYAHGFGSASFWQWIGIDGLNTPYLSPVWYPSDPGWWWWRATRMINTFVQGQSTDYTIAEFPFFSFKLGDMHPHILALPLGLLALALSLQFLFERHQTARDGEGAIASSAMALSWQSRLSQLLLGYHWVEVLVAMIVLGSLGFANSWDLPTYLFIFLCVIAIVQYRLHGRWSGRLIWQLLSLAMVVGLGSILLYIPFYLEFRSQASGVLPVSGPGTRPVHFLLFWGVFLFLFGSLLVPEVVRAVRGVSRNPRQGLWALAAAYSPVVVWRVAITAKDTMLPGPGTPAHQAWSLWLLPLAAATVLYVLFRRISAGLAAIPSVDGSLALVDVQGLNPYPSPLPLREEICPLSPWGRAGVRAVHPPPATAPDRIAPVVFALLLGFVGLLLTLGAELFFIRDVFGTRMNTVFKFYYQAWVLLAISSGFALYYCQSIWNAMRRPWVHLRYAWWLALLLLVAGALVYPLAVVQSDLGNSQGSGALDGLDFVQRSNPDEYQAIAWLQSNVRGTPVILEAPGDRDYSELSRVSARTGLPTVIGWVGHELQWHGSDALFRGRSQDVDRIYTSADQAEMLGLLHRYDVRYVYVGQIEKAKYGTGVSDRFAKIGRVVFQNKTVTIFELSASSSR